MSHETNSTHPIALFRRRDTARVLGVSESIVCRLERQGLLRAIQLPNLRSTRHSAKEVYDLAERWIHSGGKPAEAK